MAIQIDILAAALRPTGIYRRSVFVQRFAVVVVEDQVAREMPLAKLWPASDWGCLDWLV